MKLGKYSVEPPIEGLTKRWAIWGHDAEKNSMAPLVYLERPKWIKDDSAWEKIVRGIELNLKMMAEIR